MIDDADAQLESVDYGSPLLDILPYMGSKSVDKTQIYYCPMDPDPRGLALLDASGNCLANGAPPPAPGFLTSAILEPYCYSRHEPKPGHDAQPIGLHQ